MLRNASILVVDDEEIMREILESLLSRQGCRVRLAGSGEEAVEMAKADPFDAAVVDVMMPGIDGLQTLEQLQRIDADLPIVMITAFGTAANTREAFKRGAFDFIEKPFKNDDVLVVLRNAVAQRRLVTENRTLRQSLQAQSHRLSDLIGRSPRMRRVFDLITQAAPSRTTILVQGESGTGKELVARAVHANSARSDRPFITVNSGSLPPDLLESNLFGHVKGAFTGAVSLKKGLFELADRGSIFFDEIGTVPLETQAKLLRVIQEREFMRLGGVDTLKVDVRIIAATNVDLKQLVDNGEFREDLYYRLHVITVELPGLRERREDIPLLAQHFLAKYGKENRKPGLELAPEALRLLEEYNWPGNVRELENVIERAVVLTSGTTIGTSLMPDAIRTPQRFQLPSFEMPPDGIPFRKVIEEMETMLITRSLDAAGGIQKRAAELLQIKPTTLNEMIKRYGIRPRGKRGAPAERKSESGLAGARQSRARDLPDSVAANLIDKRLSSRG
ncbi:MAG: sigma-54 dependent transcriptional regulator [Acidobacteriota bacterium]|nr:sigma-54 dependent transcriptional regulator [Acidobacteriota bacterium]